MDVNRYSNLFKALGDPNRLRIIAMLQDGEKCANDILEQIEISQSTLSHHLKQLTDADLIVTYRDGKMLYYSINNDTFEKCRDTLGMLMTLPVTQLPVNDVKRQSERALSLVVGKLIKYMCVIDIPSDVYQVIEQTE
ncbi:MAG: winged helix-turn-helix transcriptional regulator, partial [Eubacterium sp.]|nr:winged helix-turn-helix transcriptional regulator [Eubacterium sp.]